jgi:hypothetical protein
VARARNVKPGLFKNEVLGVADPMYTLLFEGLWLLADREGRLEDRPVRIKGELFPYRDGLDMGAMLDWLQQEGFIRRYQACGMALIQILAFAKHQSPHGTEKDSELPDENGRYTVHTRGKNGYATGEVSFKDSGLTVKELSDNSLIPDSLIPDSLTPTDVGDSAAKPRTTRRKKPEQTLQAYLDVCKAAGQKPLPVDHPIRAWCADAGITEEMLQVAWCVFRDDHLTGKSKDKPQRDWPAHFANSVRRRWYQLWFMDNNGAAWTSTGLQEKAVLETRHKAKEGASAPE